MVKPILKCAIDGCKSLNKRILQGEIAANLPPMGLKRFYNERLFQHETALQIMEQMHYQVRVDVDVNFEIEGKKIGKNVDLLLIKDNKNVFVGECKNWKSNDGKSEFNYIIPELRRIEGLGIQNPFYLVFTIHAQEQRSSNLNFFNNQLKIFGIDGYSVNNECFTIIDGKNEVFEIFYLEKMHPPKNE